MQLFKHLSILLPLAVAGGICLGQVQIDPASQQRSLRPYSPGNATPSGTSEPEPVMNEVSFDGGTADQLTSALAKALGQRPNVLISPQLRDTTFPAFQLRHVTLEDVFNALNTMARSGQGEWAWVRNSSGSAVWTLVPSKTPAPQPGYAVPYQGFGGLQPPPAPRREVQIFPVGAFLEKYKIEDITTAIETAWDLLKKDNEAELKYHKDTQLLIAVGDPQQISIISSVLQGLSNQLEKGAGGEHENGPKKTNTTSKLSNPAPPNKP